jgi:hypothetical protein
MGESEAIGGVALWEEVMSLGWGLAAGSEVIGGVA